MAKERFNRALDANRTNYFAYQYLGFIAVHDENSQEAINNFDLARKFADSGHSRALALSHLARSYQAAGDLRKAIQSSTAATEAAPERARFWYETAVYRVRASNAEEAILNLRQAISTDWTYWSVSISDANLDPLRNRVERLLADMREEQRVLARQRLDHFVGTLKILREMQIMADIAGWEKRLEQFESSYRTGTVFAFRDLVEPARDVERQALEAAVVALDQRINTLHKALTKAQADCSRELSQAFSRVQEIENRASSVEKSYSSSGFAGCLAVIGGIVAAWCFVGFNAVPAFDSADRHNYAVGGMVAFVILIIGLGWKPMMKLLNADLPARNIRSEIPGAKQAYERIKADSESRLGVEKAGIDRELGPLTQYKEQCRARSTSV
jgi:tetratricopeptide (TPR) repeat protein